MNLPEHDGYRWARTLINGADVWVCVCTACRVIVAATDDDRAAHDRWHASLTTTEDQR